MTIASLPDIISNATDAPVKAVSALAPTTDQSSTVTATQQHRQPHLDSGDALPRQDSSPGAEGPDAGLPNDAAKHADLFNESYLQTSQSETQPQGLGLDSITSAGKDMMSGAVKGVNSSVTAATNLTTNTATLTKDATNAGLAISQKVAKSGMNTTSNVVTHAADITGTALGGVVHMAANTTQVFEPVSSGLRAVEGFAHLGDSSDRINGLVIGAARQIERWAMRALNMSGMVCSAFCLICHIFSNA
jgi:hypothetical protein